MKKPLGFTIVEILIVCAVIGILFTIVSAAWAFTIRDSEDDTRLAQQREWVSRFETYRAQHGVYPNSASATNNSTPLNSRYCLGTDFPNNRCGDGIVATAVTSNRVLQELSKVGTLPEYTPKQVKGYAGPWVDYRFSDQIRVYQAYYNETCPTGTIKDTAYSGGVACYITLKK